MSDRSQDGKTVHVYDGIEEQDNHLPNWWLYTLYGACVFALGYWIYYQGYGVGHSPLQAYQKAKAVEKRAQAAQLMALGDLNDAQLLEMAKNPTIVKQGAEIFTSTCFACHLANGGGKIGPNLTDEFWLHGGKPTDILRTVRIGVPDKGMLAWGPQLGEEKVRAVTAYVLTIVDTNVPGGKEPQGEKVAGTNGAAGTRPGGS
jgi:cytochrome c oxidase cbb3-type subunit 3